MNLYASYLVQVLLFVSFALSLNLLLGYAGQVSVAHASFGAVGGYTVGYLALHNHVNIVIALAVGMVLSFLLGGILGLPALRLPLEFLILLTLAVGLVIIGAIGSFPALGGVYGLVGIPDPDFLGYHLGHPIDFILPLVAVTAAIWWVCHRIGESAYGRVLKGIREDDVLTRALGKDIVSYKVWVFALTSGMAALSGGLYASYNHLSTQALFGFNTSLKIFAIVIFGGMANLTGSVIGAIVVVLTEPLLENQPFVDIDARNSALLQLIIYGLLLVVLMRWRSQGVLPEGFSIRQWLRRRRDPPDRVEMVSNEDWVPDVSVRVNDRDEDERAADWQRAPVVLEVAGITKRFGGITAVDQLTMQLRKGTITALVGPNGAGKTTVFNLLTGFLPPEEGSVKLNGVEMVGHTPDWIARQGMVRSFQDVRIVNRLSCLQNVMLGVQDQPGEHLRNLFLHYRQVDQGEADTRDKAMEWLSFVGMAAFAEIPGGALSYGQTKLISLARVLATEAEVLLLDEPASGVDTKWVDTQLDLVLSLKEQGRTVCIVEHNLHVVGRLADHAYFMELGRITAEGPISELTSSPELAEAYFGSTV